MLIRQLAPALAALCVATALVAIAVTLTPSANGVELASMQPLAVPTDPAERKHLFQYLSTQSYTAPDERKYLASRFQIKQDAPMQRLSEASAQPSAGNKGAVAGNDKAAQAQKERPREPNYDVAYFSTFLRPQAHWTRGGMHAAASGYADELRRQGVVYDNGKYLNAKEGKALAKELNEAQEEYSSIEERDPAARPYEGYALSANADQKLVSQLVAGEKYSFLSNFGRKRKQPEYVQGAAQQKLVRDLEQGEKYSLLPNFGQKEVKPVATLQQRESEEQLVRDLEQGEEYANLGGGMPAPRGQKMDQLRHSIQNTDGAVDSRARATWGIPDPSRPPVELTQPQDRNLANYLNTGLKEVFGLPKPVPMKYVNRQEAESLMKGAKQAAWEEYEAQKPRREHYYDKKEGESLANSLTQSLRTYESGQGPYVNHYLHNVEGSKYFQSRSPSAGLRFYRRPAANQAQNDDHMLTLGEGRALASFLTPQASVTAGQASALGYAV